MNFVKKEVGNRVPAEIVNKYLNIPQIGIGDIKEVYAEILRIESKFTVDGNPFISFRFKDINGRVISASMFDSILESEIIEKVSKLKKVYCFVKYNAVCVKSFTHLQILSIAILDSSEITEELLYAFTPEFENKDLYLKKIEDNSFGEYEDIFNILNGANVVKSLGELSFEEFGNAKIGAMSKVVVNVLNRIDDLNFDSKYLTKIVALYSIVFYCKHKKICTLGTQNGIIDAIRNLSSALDIFRTKIPGVLTERFCEEVERVVCNLFDIPIVNSLTSETIKLILKSEKELSELELISKSSPSGYLLNYKGDKLVNK